MWGTYRCTGRHMNVWEAYSHMGMCRHIGRHTDIWEDVQMPPNPDRHTNMPDNPPTCLPLNEGKISLYKAKFQHLKRWKIVREPPGCTGNKPTLDIHIGGSGQDIKKMTNTCHLQETC